MSGAMHRPKLFNMNTDPHALVAEFEARARFTSVPMEKAEPVFLFCLDETTREKLRVEFQSSLWSEALGSA